MYVLTSRYNESVWHVYDGVELRILLHLVLDPAAEVFPESVDPLREASELRVAQLLKECGLRTPIFRGPQFELESLIIEVGLDKLKGEQEKQMKRLRN